MSNLVLGTVQFGLSYGINNSVGKPDLSSVKEILKVSKDHGINELDTAQGYGDAENVLCQALGVGAKNFLIHSKFSLMNGFSVEEIEERLRVSLKNLGAEKIGYFFFHRFSDFLEMQKLKMANSEFIQKHSLGLAVSVYGEEEFKQSLESDFVKAIQLPFNLLDASEEKLALMKTAKEKGVALYCRSVFLQGLFFMNPNDLSDKLKPLAPALKRINEISKEYNVSVMTLSLGFVRQFPELDGVLIGVETAEQLQSNLKAWDEKVPMEAIKKIQEIEITNKNLLHPRNWN
jgi:uncharacterized protein